MNGESGPIGTTKQLLSEEVFLHLGMAIVRGELAPHDRIRDADIARELHVSRMPIREALQRLERIGLVTMYPSRYTEVTAVSDGLVADSAEFAGYQAGIAARLAAERMTDSERIGALTLIAAADASLGDVVQYSLARRALFAHLSEVSGNALQSRLMRETNMALARNLRHVAPPESDRHRTKALHAELGRALQDQDANAAERVSRAIHGV
jgi:DNA-binding GntR family transcriptional regulator